MVLIAAGLAVAAASTPAPIGQASASLLPVLAGTAEPTTAFAPSFLAQIPADQVRDIAARLRAEFGDPKRIETIEPAGRFAGRVRIHYEKAVVEAELIVAPAPPHGITLFRTLGAASAAATLDAVAAEVQALPGRAALLVQPLGHAKAAPPAAVAAEAPLAVGSAFKLVVLAELVRAVKAGERRWDDVAPLGDTSLPSGISQDWPDGVPVTLHTLATLMISRSDNRAADTLLRLLGREKVEAMQARVGIADPARNRPFLSTSELFKLKGGDLGPRYAAADEAGRRALLAGKVAAFPLARVDAARFTGTPLLIEEIEWFASAADLARVMDWLRRETEDPKGAAARAILAVAPGLAPAQAARFAFAGFKGGSEGGVVNLTLLVRTKQGGWFAIVGTWNDPGQPVNEARFAALVARGAELMADR